MKKYKKLAILTFVILFCSFFTVSYAQKASAKNNNKSIVRTDLGSAVTKNSLDLDLSENKNQSEVIRIYSSSWKGIAAGSFILSLILIYVMIKFTAEFSVLESMDKVIFLYFLELLPLVNIFLYILLYLVFDSTELLTEIKSLSADYIPLENINFSILLGMIVQAYIINLINLVYFKHINIHFQAQLFIAALPLFFLLLLFLTLSFGEFSLVLLPMFYLIALLSPFISLLMLLKQIRLYFHGESEDDYEDYDGYEEGDEYEEQDETENKPEDTEPESSDDNQR